MEMTPPAMNILLNGETREISPASTIAGLLAHLNLEGKPVVVEHNEKAVLPRDYRTTPLAEGDRVEIVTLAAGG